MSNTTLRVWPLNTGRSCSKKTPLQHIISPSAILVTRFVKKITRLNIFSCILPKQFYTEKRCGGSGVWRAPKFSFGGHTTLPPPAPRSHPCSVAYESGCNAILIILVSCMNPHAPFIDQTAIICHATVSQPWRQSGLTTRQRRV